MTYWAEFLCLFLTSEVDLLSVNKFYLTVSLILHHLTNETLLVIKYYKMFVYLRSIFEYF